MIKTNFRSANVREVYPEYENKSLSFASFLSKSKNDYDIVQTCNNGRVRYKRNAEDDFFKLST